MMAKTNSVADTVIIVAKTLNSAPIANAGADQNVPTKTLTTLNGIASSDTNGDALTYKWSFTSMPTGSLVSLSNPTTASPTFTPDIDGTYIAQLIVNDGTVDSSADLITVIASKSNSAPIANADVDQSVNLNTVVNLDGSKSTDADSDGLSYLWSFVSKPADSTATLDNTTVVNPTFRADVTGSYVLSLIVSDGLISSTSDNVQITVIAPSVTLYQKQNDFFGGGSFTKTSFPYSSSASVQASVSGIPAPTTYTLATFNLKAQGKSFTITNVSATDTTAKVVPYFSGISENLVIADGTEVQFALISPLTGGSTTNLLFSFKVLETGETFTASYTFKSN
jgi:hypothetical protein